MIKQSLRQKRSFHTSKSINITHDSNERTEEARLATSSGS